MWVVVFFFFKQRKMYENSCLPIFPSATGLKGLLNFCQIDESSGGVAYLEFAFASLLSVERLSRVCWPLELLSCESPLYMLSPASVTLFVPP